MPPPLPPGFVLQQPSAAPPPPPPGFAVQRQPIPRIINGPPREAPLHGQETPAETAIDQGRAAAAQYDEPTARANAARAAAAAERERLQLHADQQNAALGSSAQATESERKAASFLLRALGSNQAYETTHFQPRSVPGQWLADAFPSIAYANADPQRQRAEGAQNEFIAASLRQDSGAAIPPAEIETQRQIYFPRPGASPEAMAEARAARARAIAGLLNAAGRSANPQMRHAAEGYLEALSRYNAASLPGAGVAPAGQSPPGSPPPAPQGGGEPAGAPPQQRGPIEFGVQPTTPTGFEAQQIAAYDAFWQQNPRATAEQLRAAFPNVINAEAIVAARDAGAGVAPGRSWVMQRPNAEPVDITSARGGSPEAANRAAMENAVGSQLPLLGPLVTGDQWWRGPEAANALLHGGEDWATFGLRDEGTAAINTLAGGDRTYNQNLNFERGVDQYDNENHFYDRLGGQIGVGLPEAFAPGGLPAQAIRGGAQGFLYGLGSGEGNFLQRLPNAAVGATIGAVAPPVFAGAGRVIGAGARRLFRSPEVAPEARAIAEAGAAEEVPLSRPIVDPSSRERMMGLEASGPRPSNEVRDSLQGTRAGIEERAGQLGAEGTAREPGMMGERIRGAADRFMERSRALKNRLYDRAAQMAGSAPVHARDAVAEIDQQIAGLQGNAHTNAPEIDFLQKLRRDFVDDQGNLIPKTVQQIRDIRTNLRGNVNNAGLTFNQTEGRVLSVLDAARADISRDLAGTSPGAVRAYARADRFNRERASEIEQVIRPLVGARNAPASGERVWQSIRRMAGPNGDSAGLTRLFAKLEPEERADVAATIAESAGRAGPDDVFTPGRFLSFARSLSPSGRRTIFGDQGAQSIANLRVLSQALMDTTGRLNNSGSGAATNQGIRRAWRETLGALIGVGGSAAAGGGGSAALAATVTGAALGMGTRSIGDYARLLSARTLMSPDMSRWLAAAPRQGTASAIAQHIQRLSGVASRDPAIAQEVQQLQQAMLHAVNDNLSHPGTLAASPPQGPDNANQ